MGKLTTPGEPIWTIGGAMTFVAALLLLLVSYGVDITAEQQAGIMGVWAIVAPSILTILARRKVIPAENVAAAVNKNGELVSGPALGTLDGLPVEVWQTESQLPEA